MAKAIESKVAIVSGAVQGIGEALVRALLTRGWNVGALDLDDKLGKSLEDEFGEKVVYVRCDMSNYNQQAAAFTTIFQKWGRIDAFCSNAGIAEVSQLYKLDHTDTKTVPPEPSLNTSRVSFFGFMYGVQLSIHFMRQNPVPGGHIIGTSSGLSTHPTPAMPEHAASKAAMNTFTIAAAPFLKFRENITINTVLPGMVPTRSIPPAMQKVFDGYLTPIDTIVRAYLKLLQDQSLNGQMLETFRDNIVPVPAPAFIDPDIPKTLDVWEAQFIAFHGQPSGLPGAHPA